MPQQQGTYRLSEIEPEAPAAPAAGSGRFRLADVVEEPLTLERRAPGASALDVGHHPDTIGEHPHAKFGRAVVGAVLDPENLPAVGGVLGGIVGSAVPGAGTVLGGTAGATLFGGLGAAARAMSRSASGRPEPTGEELGLDIVKSGAKEGAAQLIGSGLAKAAGPVGRALYGKALAPSKALTAAHPDLVQTGIREGLNVTPKGAVQAANAVRAEVAENVFRTPRMTALEGVEQAISEATKRPGTLRRVVTSAGVGAIPGLLANPMAAAGTGLATAVATSPRVMGRAGIILGRTGDSAAAQRLAGLAGIGVKELLEALDAGPTDAAGRPVDAGNTIVP